MSRRFVLVFLISAFALHLLWEFAQCGPFYVAGKVPLTVGAMLYVTAADVALSALLYAVVSVGLWDRAWGLRRPWTAMLALMAIGAAFAIAVEMHAVATNRWSYSEIMPRLPILGAGLLPVLQLALVTAVSTWIAGSWAARMQRPDTTGTHHGGRNSASGAPPIAAGTSGAPRRTTTKANQPPKTGHM